MLASRFLPVFFLALILSMPLSAQDTSAQKNRIAQLEKEIAMLEKQLKENEKNKASVLSNLTLVQKKAGTRRKLVKESEKKIATMDMQIISKQRDINAMSARLDTMTLYYDRLVKNAYKNRDYRIWYLYILAGDSFSQSFRRFAYLRNLSSQMREQARKIKDTRASLETEKEVIKGMRAQMRDEKKAYEAELVTLRGEESQARGMISKLQKDSKKYQSEVASKRKEVEALNREIARIIEESLKGTGKKGPARQVDYKLSGEFSANKGKLPWPVDGVLLEGFGKHNHPVYKTIEMPANNGLTYSVSKGAKVSAVFDGEVRKIIVMPGYRQCVLVQHGNYFTFYCKLGSVKVKAGQKVKTGDTIGTVETIAGESQFHFQLWEGRTPQNPELWLRR
ncbi:MAG: peptidoglycan DD-metalloendopeptidase family protein [Bacteroidales bacterium]|nr:peptidoglycan DD-metalloendopeptidase family protein [Bacteroidales bacterium]